MNVVRAVGDALYTGSGLFWKAAWALALGYAISAAIQVFVSRRQAAGHLGSGTPAQLGVAMLLGFASSSCSFAALSATRSLWTKGAALTSALAFMFASTNLAVEVAALARSSLAGSTCWRSSSAPRSSSPSWPSLSG